MSKFIKSFIVSLVAISLDLCISFVLYATESWRIPVVEETHSRTATAAIATEGPMVPYSFVDTLKGFCALTRVPLATQDIGLDALKDAGEINLFFRGTATTEPEFGGIVKQLGDKLVVAFPGTRTDQMVATLKSDVITDISVFEDDGGFSSSVGVKGVVVHPGFAKEVIAFWKNMMACVRKHTSYNEIYFTGHSKGGGIALLSALKYAHDNNVAKDSNFVKVFTFAAPAVFDGDGGYNLFHNYISGLNTICIYKNEDAVPYSSMPFKYVHVGIQANVSKNLANASDVTDEMTEFARLIVRRVTLGEKSLASRLGERLVSDVVGSHFLDGFSRSQIRDVMERIKENYWLDPEMPLVKMGREQKASCVIL